MGSQAIGVQIGLKNVLTTDIGGTSFDVGVVADGKPIMRSEIALAGADIRVHSIDVDSIGAGGGSIAQVHFGELRVGPQSAGAYPGPAAYGRGGTKATVTDANVVLGRLNPRVLLGGRMAMHPDRAEKAVTRPRRMRFNSHDVGAPIPRVVLPASEFLPEPETWKDGTWP